MTTSSAKPVNAQPKRKSIWGWLAGFTIGNAFRLFWWSIGVVFLAILVEWMGMLFIWETDHSHRILELEMSYLGSYSRNLVLGIYPADIGLKFVSSASDFIEFVHLRALSDALANSVESSAGHIALYGIDAVINVIFIFAVRSAICVSALTGFALVGIVAFVDGLVERDIRRACGGIESGVVYHVSKRLVKPLLFLSFGGYLTMPVSIHPTLVFLPVMAVFGISVFTAARTYKKFV